MCLPWNQFFAFGILSVRIHRNKRIFKEEEPYHRLVREVRHLTLKYFHCAGCIKTVSNQSIVNVRWHKT